MDVTRPKVTWIGTKCFRRLDLGIETDVTGDWSRETSERPETTALTTAENDGRWTGRREQVTSGGWQEENEQWTSLIVSGPNGNFEAALPISKQFFGCILGKQGRVKMEIQDTFGVRINVPGISETGDVIIRGNSKSNVLSAIKRIFSIVEITRLRRDPTHFISIPLNSAIIKRNFIEFKNQVLIDNECATSRGVCEDIFQLDCKLHLTLGMLYLADQSERTRAAEILQKCSTEFIKPLLNGSEVIIRIEGVEYFHDDPSQISVLFARVVDLSENNCFRLIINEIFTRFEQNKLINRNTEYVDENCKVKLHMTLMNTKNKLKAVEENNWRRPKETFDATAIIKHFGNFLFGEVSVKKIHLSMRHAFGEDGYYQSTSVIEI